MKVSVCMAAYNGEKYIEEQISSILCQLGAEDELIIVDDASTDATFLKVKSFNDARINLYKNEKNSGHVRSFERAILESKNEVIFLADQDDIWVEGRVKKMMSALLDSKAAVLCTSMKCFGGRSSIFDRFVDLDGLMDNRVIVNVVQMFLGKIPYFGCAMCFRAEMKSIILPIPHYVEAHDIWVATVGNILGVMHHSAFVSLMHRIHQSNVTPLKSRSIKSKLKSRIILLRMIAEACSRCAK